MPYGGGRLTMTLLNFEEALHKVQLPESKPYIQEAVKCYELGLYRQAIMSAWIAVCVDLIAKIDQIGDEPFNKDKYTELQNLKKNFNPQLKENRTASQKFESNLLTYAQVTLQLLNAKEKEELENYVYLERHLSAHPAMLDDLSLYVPSAEKTRLALRCVFEYALFRSHKTNIFADRLFSLLKEIHININSEEDSLESETKLRKLFSTHLKDIMPRAKKELCFKIIEDTDLKFYKTLLSIKVLFDCETFEANFKEKIYEKLYRYCESNEDDNNTQKLFKHYLLLHCMPSVYNEVGITKVKNTYEPFPIKPLLELNNFVDKSFFFGETHPLYDFIVQKIKSEKITAYACPLVVPALKYEVLENWIASSSYDGACHNGETLWKYRELLSQEERIQAVIAIFSNDQIYGSKRAKLICRNLLEYIEEKKDLDVLIPRLSWEGDNFYLHYSTLSPSLSSCSLSQFYRLENDKYAKESQFRKIILDSSVILPEDLANFLEIDLPSEDTDTES